jgi:hypothetical protein
MDRSDVAAAISELAAQKLAERATDQNDRRRYIITITAKGRHTCGGSTPCWPTPRMNCSHRCRLVSAKPLSAFSPGCWIITTGSFTLPPLYEIPAV